jgi:hypothetical protein
MDAEEDEDMRSRWWFRFWLVALLATMPVLVGCPDDGDDGRDGVDGADGAPGADGADANVTDLVPLGGLTADDVIASNLVLNLNDSVAYDAATGAVTVHFFLTDEDGDAVDVTQDAFELRVYVSELVPSDAAEDPGPNWHQLIAERGTPAVEGEELPGTLTLVDAATGEYTYVLGETLAASTNVIRVTVRARWRTSERDKNGDRIVFANPVNASYDFLQADPATRLDASGADMVTTAACESCHGARIGDVGHGGGYTQVKTCNHCHNLDYQEVDEADLAFMIHRIHVAGTFVDLVDDGEPVDFSEVTYPQHIFTCGKCHTAEAPNADLAYTNPTRRNCGACHSDVNFTKSGEAGPTPVDFATGTNHEGGAQANDAQCGLCHTEGGLGQGPIEAHDVAPDPKNVSEFQVTISMTAPANGEYYVAGETPVVTVTLADADGDPVAGTVYTADADGEGVDDVGEGLSLASLYVYGPRDEAVPVLTTNSTTDGGAQQAHSLLLTGGVSADLRVMTDANGYKYQLMDNIGDLEPGTYMVRFEGADYGALTDEDYVTASSALINFQVGTAEVEPKVSGDACTDCHGATIMHLEGAHPHHAPFDTDHCLGCHDKSVNYAEYIGNRVHAVHRATITGDLHTGRDWSEVTFPRPANNCTTCHTNLEADTPVWRTPFMLACGGCHGVLPEADPDTYPEEQQEQVRREVAAAQHMTTNGGDADAESDGVTPTLQCLTCHGAGRIADLYNTHNLVQFRELPEDPNE